MRTVSFPNRLIGNVELSIYHRSGTCCLFESFVNQHFVIRSELCSIESLRACDIVHSFAFILSVVRLDVDIIFFRFSRCKNQKVRSRALGTYSCKWNEGFLPIWFCWEAFFFFYVLRQWQVSLTFLKCSSFLLLSLEMLDVSCDTLKLSTICDIAVHRSLWNPYGCRFHQVLSNACPCVESQMLPFLWQGASRFLYFYFVHSSE